MRPYGERYQLIAGERRWRAIRDYTDIKAIKAQIVTADDLQARRISAAENLQREDLSAIETIELKTLLGKLDAVRTSKARNSEISREAKLLFYKFVE